MPLPPSKRVSVKRSNPHDYPVVAIVGRPNVGKSTLFNRLIGRRRSIVHHESGTTRDFIQEVISWRGNDFLLVDTGGVQFAAAKTLESSIDEQARQFLTRADILLWVVDLQSGPAPLDYDLADILRRSEKNIIVVPNKADRGTQGADADVFMRMGFKEMIPVSAMHGHGTGELLDAVVTRLPLNEQREVLKPDFYIAIVGEPNAGKSTFLNQILSEDRAIVSEIPGTTRDSIEEIIPWRGKTIGLIDTAGMRARSKQKEVSGFFSMSRTREAIQKADIVLLFFDAERGFLESSKRIARLICDEGKGLVLVANKWDKVDRGESRYEEILKKWLPFLGKPRMAFVSALEGKNLEAPLDSALELWKFYCANVATKSLNDFLKWVSAKNPPPPTVKLKFMVQYKTRPPSFTIFAKNRKRIPVEYFLYLRNRLVERYKLEGIPIVLHFKEAEAQEKEGAGKS